MKRVNRQPQAFTLTELLISMGLALFLLYGVNRVFTTTARTIGTGMAVSETMRAMRSVEHTFTNDFEGYTSDPTTGIVTTDPTNATAQQPLIIIRSQRIRAWVNKAEQDAAAAEGITDAPWRRIDTLSFFAKGTFNRQTGQTLGGNETMVTQMGKPADYAWIWYGHARLPDPSLVNNDFATLNLESDYHPPLPDGDAHYRHAGEWVLGRRATLLYQRDATTLPPGQPGYVVDAAGNRMVFIAQDTPVRPLSPFAYGSQTAHTNGTADTPLGQQIQWSLCDVAGIVADPQEEMGAKTDAITEFGFYKTVYDAQTATPPDPFWWQSMVYRFNCNPFIQKPVYEQGSAKAALASTYFAGGVTDFIVEFAGDFDSDGVIDTFTDGGISGIQWYGLQRDIDGDGVDDVAPLPGNPSFQKEVDIANTPALLYTAVFGPQEMNPEVPGHTVILKPMLIRITMTIVDPNGRLSEGVTREFIYKVK